jgi:hypothetical protein
VRAVVTLRREPSYRVDAFEAGLRKLGYSITTSINPRPRAESADDLLVLWNYHSHTLRVAADWEAEGGTVIVCENGYLGVDDVGRQFYAIAIGQHNGAGWTPRGVGRFDRLGIEPLPIRSAGEQIVVRAQRGIGAPGLASPPDWHSRAARVIAGSTKRPVRVVPHPGNKEPKPTGEKELAGAWTCVIWSSSMGVRSLVMGIPVVFDSPHWICEEAGCRGLDSVDEATIDETKRANALERMAWAQWSVDEITSGAPFERFRAENWGRP